MAEVGPGSAAALWIGAHKLDLARGLLLDGAGAEVPLRPKAFGLLRALASSAGRTVPKSELMDALWPGIHVTEDSLFQCVRQARQALGDAEGRVLRHLPRRGYLLDAAAEREAPPPAQAMLAAAASTPLVQIECERPSVAVLPFAHAEDLRCRKLAIDVAEELVTALSRIRALRVIAAPCGVPASADDAAATGRRRGLGYVVCGRVRDSAGMLRIDIRLVESATGAVLWAAGHDAPAANRSALPDRVARDLAVVAEARIMDAELARSDGLGAADPTAHHLYLRAVPALRMQARRPWEAVEGLLREAVARDPRHARALAALSRVLLVRTRHQWHPDPDEGAEEAVALARQAIAADRMDADILGSASCVLAVVGGEHDEAAELATTALAANPNSPTVWFYASQVSAFAGRDAEALQRADQALALDPVLCWAPRLFTSRTKAHFFAQRFEEAHYWARRAAAAGGPEYTWPVRYAAAALAAQGQVAEAGRVGAPLRALMPEPLRALGCGRPVFRHRWMKEMLGEYLRRASLPA